MSPPWAVVTLFHLVAFGVNLSALWYDVLYISEHGEGVLEYRGFGGKFKHLTFWDQVDMYKIQVLDMLGVVELL